MCNIKERRLQSRFMKDTHDVEENIHTEELPAVYRPVLCLICLSVLLLAAAFFLLPKGDFSESENRSLAKLPEFSVQKLSDGSYTEGLEKYAADHFPLRDAFLGLMTEAERITGRRLIEGVYLAKDGSLIEEYGTVHNTEKQITQFQRLSDALEYAACSPMLVPTAVSTSEELLPDNCPAAVRGVTQTDVIDEIYSAVEGRIRTVDVRPLIGVSGDRVYYRTDHHWTTDGAYCGYEAWCTAAGIEPEMPGRLKKQRVTGDFRGTLYSKLNDPFFGTDAIDVIYDDRWRLRVTYEDSKEVSDSLYNMEYLDKRDKYSLFLNNIHSLVTIENGAVAEGELAVIKDSYANCMIPFLVSHYHRIYVFDTRYYKGGPSKFINSHPGIKDVLLVYNMNTIDNDTGIGGIY